MKLISFIPEIKIYPKFREPKIGDIIYFPEDKDGEEESYKIVGFEKEDENNPEHWYWRLQHKNDDPDDGPRISVDNLALHLKNRTAILKEIKIQPNTKYKVGDHFDSSVQPNPAPECVITSIRDGNVYYDSLDKQWGKDGNHRSQKEFDKLINRGKWIIIPKDIDEIKIHPNSTPKNINELLIFVKNNQKEIVDKTYDNASWDAEDLDIIEEDKKQYYQIKPRIKDDYIILANPQQFSTLSINLLGTEDRYDESYDYYDITVKGVKLVTQFY